MFDTVDEQGAVFSAHAEVVPGWTYLCDKPRRILRARGGSSYTDGPDGLTGRYSPRTRR